jgi:hypothetical protein
MESLAAVQLLRRHFPELKIRFVNVVDLMALEHPSRHPHGISDERFLQIFSPDRPVIFAFHGYPQLIHRLIYRRPNHVNFHVHGYREEGTTTTLLDMVVLNALDRFHLAEAAVNRFTRFGEWSGSIRAHGRPSVGRASFLYPGQARRHAGNPRLALGSAGQREWPESVGASFSSSSPATRSDGVLEYCASPNCTRLAVAGRHR